MTSKPYTPTAEDVVRRWERLDGTALTDREMTPEERLALVREVNLGMIEAASRMRTAIVDVVRGYLVYESQRAVSWHEIQDCLAEIDRLPQGN